MTMWSPIVFGIGIMLMGIGVVLLGVKERQEKTCTPTQSFRISPEGEFLYTSESNDKRTIYRTYRVQENVLRPVNEWWEFKDGK